MAGPFISFLTDFGGESAPAVCRGVMLSISADARILDLNHQIRKFAVRDGAFLLARAVSYLPIGVHLAVVDPGVGTQRRPIALLTGRGDRLVGPDNGLLRPAAEILGGVVEARTLENPDLFLPTVSSTFHGRDLFAPVAAHLANGTPFGSVGPRVDPASLVDLAIPDVAVEGGSLVSVVLFVDSFGNVRIAGERDDLERLAGPLIPGRRLRLSIGATGAAVELAWATTFGDAGPDEALVYDDADYAGLAIAVNQGSAADRFGLAIDDGVRLEPI